MTETKRAALKARVEAAQDSVTARRARKFAGRVEDGALEAKDRFTEFAKEHPIVTVAGGVAVGVLIASMFKGPRQAAVRTGTKAATKASGLASIGSEIALAFATQMIGNASEAGREGKQKIVDLTDKVGDKARDARRLASHKAANASDAARIAKREAGKTIARALRKP